MNIIPYKINLTPDEIVELVAPSLTDHQYQEPSRKVKKKTGWVPVFGEKALKYVSGRTLFQKLQVVTRSVPKAELDRQMKEREAATGRAPDRDVLEDELLQQDFPKTTHHLVWWDTANSMLYVEAGSYKVAEMVTEEMRKAIGSLPIEPMKLTNAAGGIPLLTVWLGVKDLMPEGLSVTEECELKDEDGQKAVFSNHDLYDQVVLDHIADGKQVKKLGLSTENTQFTLTDDFQIKKLKLTVKPDGEAETEDDIAAAEMVLLAGEVRELMDIVTT